MASTSSQTPSSSTSISTTPTSWDVFLSFHGKDTRNTFTSHLYFALDRYNNIRTFMDDPALRCGEVISDALVKAIQESKTYIVVFSENYASSSWCLDELVEILSCSNKMERLVIPVFYNIDPSVVRHQSGSFKEHFKRHVDRLAGEMERVEDSRGATQCIDWLFRCFTTFFQHFNRHEDRLVGENEVRYSGEIQRVQNWRVTLTQVANKSGKHVDGKRSEAVIVNEIVDEILLQIKSNVLHVAEYKVGLKSRVDEITAMLSRSTKGVIKIGIYGMGGVGKTTLAKEVFNQLLQGSFKGSCFLQNVREISGKKGLASLQQQLINDVLKSKSENKVKVHSVDEGTKLIESRICSIKILVVIDDLDNHREFKSLVRPFASGSVVIITTRDVGTLDKVEVETKYRYRVNELGEAESEKLFFHHAFRDTKPNNTLTILSKDILRLAGGLPLALEVFGGYLYTESENSWKSYIETLQRNPDDTIQERLMISLNALKSKDLKKMFLDIACFFIGRKKEEVVEILDTYYSHTDDKIDKLMKKSLLTINDYNRFQMHDLLQDVGKEIARNNSPDEPGKYSRLWVPKDVCSVLEEHKGTEAIEGIVLHPKDSFFKKVSDPANETSFDMETFRRMSKLRFLSFDDINLTGKFKRTPEDLRWFCWSGCPLKCLPFDFRPQKIVILELPHSKMTTMWEVSKAFEKLKTLNMSFSQDLTTTPDFRELPCLRKLNFDGCTSLKEVHNSIGSLVSLVSLNLKDCKKLRSLPDTICNLRALEVICIQGCTMLEALPIQLGNIKSLKELDANGLAVLKLPDSIGNLSKLVKLNLNFNKELECLPDTICNLRALEVLSISHCTKLKELPEELGKIESLKELDAESLAVSKLPDSIGDLSKLVKLNLDWNLKLESFPNTICNLRALEVLSIIYCTKVKELPEELGNIKSLKELNAKYLAVSKLPDSIGNLSKLVKLELGDNNELECLPDAICNLRALEVLRIICCTKLEALPVELGNIESLREFQICESPISKLPDSICSMRSLEILNIKYCDKLERLPDQLWKLTRLLKLYARGAALLKKLPDIQSYQTSLSLTVLDLSGSKITALPSGISLLWNLERLYLMGCGQLLSITELPPNLLYIDAEYCKSLERVNLSDSKHLETLNLAYCTSLTEISGLEELTSLVRISLQGCHSSLPARTLTKALFQIYSGFEQEISVCLESENFPDWITQSSVESVQTFSPSNYYIGFQEPNVELSSTVNLQPNLSHNYSGMILCFQPWDEELSWEFNYPVHFSVMTSASNILTDKKFDGLSSIVLVPRSIFTVTDADHTIKFTSRARRQWIHLLYKNEDDSTSVNAEDERNNLWVSDLEVEKGGYPSKRSKLLECDKTGSLEMVES